MNLNLVKCIITEGSAESINSKEESEIIIRQKFITLEPPFRPVKLSFTGIQGRTNIEIHIYKTVIHTAYASHLGSNNSP